MKLSREEERFLYRWIYDEARYEHGPGPAKRIQLLEQAKPAELAVIIAAAIPSPAEQERIALGPPPDVPLNWPWSGDEFQRRVAEAQSVLGVHQEA
jgi:hypothetical protein